MNETPIAIVLGGTYPHRTLLRNLRARGFRTVLVDYYENPCAKDCADEHVQASTLDKDTVLALARNRGASLVISACIDQANVTACSVSQELGLPCPYDLGTALIVTNKALMKEFMLRSGIPTSAYVLIADSRECAAHELRYPVIVKPVDANSSKGVRRVENQQDLSLYAREALSVSRSGKAIIEEFVEGIEIGVDCFIHDDFASVLMTKERRKIPLAEDAVQQIYGCVWPAIFSEQVNEQLVLIARKIAQNLGLKNCPLMMQAIVSDERVSVIEFAARFGGGESFKIIELSTGVDILDLSIRSFLGEDCNFDVQKCPFLYAETFLYGSPGVFGSVVGGSQLLADGTIECLHIYKTRGMQIGSQLSSNNRVGSFIVRGKCIEELRGKIVRSLARLDVLEVSGDSILRGKLYKNTI